MRKQAMRLLSEAENSLVGNSSLWNLAHTALFATSEYRFPEAVQALNVIVHSSGSLKPSTSEAILSARLILRDYSDDAVNAPSQQSLFSENFPETPKNAIMAVLWFSSGKDEKEQKAGDLRENFEQDVRLVGEKRANILAYRYAYRVAAPALGEWLRRKVVKRLLGSAVEWLNRKIN